MKKRIETLAEDRWNVEALYPNLNKWDEEYKKSSAHWDKLLSFKGTFTKNPTTLRAFFDLFFETDRIVSKLYTYAHLRHDEDIGDDENKKNFEKILKLYFDFREKFSWVEPEILSLNPEKIEEYLNSEELKPYKIYLKKIVRMKPHVLSEKEEELLALSANPLEAVRKAFGAFNNVDLKLGSVKDSQGKEMPLTHGTYGLYLRSFDRDLRENAFKAMHQSYLNVENTLTELLSGHVERHVFEAKVRKYDSCLHAALFPFNIDPSVYLSLIATVRKNLPTLHRYVDLRKKVMRVDELHLYDLYVPLVSEIDFSMKFDEAAKCVAESVELLGEGYQKNLSKGFFEQRWVDRYENFGKRSGAYSSSCYDGYPYILMNYNGSFNDVRTLAHEAGHSMHTLLSKTHQPYVYSDYPIFVAEVASTFNEELLTHFLLKHKKSKEERAYLINQKIDDIRTTLFRQTMFAEFELFLHSCAEKGIPITARLIKEQYRKLNQDYFGPGIIIDEEIDVEPLRIPHFYSNFYVYQYATGIAAAIALSKKLIHEGETAKKSYIQFLSSGSTLDPLDLLLMAGVDMKKSEPIQNALDHFKELVDEFSVLVKTS